jgi:hypothetical protein
MTIGKYITTIAVGMVLGAAGPLPLHGKTYALFFLGGQSNMVGFGKASALPPPLNQPIPRVMIFDGNPAGDCEARGGVGIWAALRPGHGIGFGSDGTTNAYSDRFGLEMSFAATLRARVPELNVALLKYARNGSSIDAAAAGQFGCWTPGFDSCNGVNQYDHFLAAVNTALSVDDIDGDAERDTLVPTCIVWMQGESDGTASDTIARRYADNLTQLMRVIRAAFRADALPVVIGRISDSRRGDNDEEKVWKFGDIIREQQAAFVRKDRNAALVVSTDAYAYSDKWHYDSAGYLDLGRECADAYLDLLSPQRKE